MDTTLTRRSGLASACGPRLPEFGAPVLGGVCSRGCFAGDLFSVGRCPWRDVADGFFVEAFGLFFLGPGRAGSSVGGLHEGSDQVYRYGEDDGGVLVYRYLPHG